VATGASAYHRLGLALAARHRQILLISAVIVALSVGVVVEGGRLTTGSIEGLESAEAQRGVDQVRGFPLTTTFLAIFESDQLAPDDEPFQAEVAAAVARARQAARGARGGHGRGRPGLGGPLDEQRRGARPGGVRDPRRHAR
jgi:hypothetical protein